MYIEYINTNIYIYINTQCKPKNWGGSGCIHFCKCMHQGGYIPPNQNRKKIFRGVSEDYRKMAMTKVYSTGGWIPWGCLIILTKNVWNLWGENLLKTMKNVCKQGCADLWLQNMQSASHSGNIFCVSFKPKWLYERWQCVLWTLRKATRSHVANTPITDMMKMEETEVE